MIIKNIESSYYFLPFIFLILDLHDGLMFDYDLLIYEDLTKIFVLNYFFETIRKNLYVSDDLKQVLKDRVG